MPGRTTVLLQPHSHKCPALPRRVGIWRSSLRFCPTDWIHIMYDVCEERGMTNHLREMTERDTGEGRHLEGTFKGPSLLLSFQLFDCKTSQFSEAEALNIFDTRSTNNNSFSCFFCSQFNFLTTAAQSCWGWI